MPCTLDAVREESTSDTLGVPPQRIFAIADLFARYANFTLGGGSATVGTLHRELLEKRHWIDAAEFEVCFALARLTPGTNVLAFCAGVGWRLRGFPGALAALLAASLPCAFMVTIATMLLSRWQANHWIQAATQGAIAAAVAITVRTVWVIIHPYFQLHSRLRVLLIGAAAFSAYVFLSLPPIEVLVLAAVVGVLLPPARA